MFRKKTVQLLWQLVQPAQLYFIIAFAANLAAALFEGSTIGLLIVALQIFLGTAEHPLLPFLSRLSVWWGGSPPSINREWLFVTAVLMAVVSQLLRSGLQFLAIAATTKLQVSVQSQGYTRLFAHVMHFSFPQVSRYRLGDLTDYLGQVQYLPDIFAYLNVLVSNLFLVVVYWAVLVWISWPLTLAGAVMFWAASRLLRTVNDTVHRCAAQSTDAMVSVSQQTAEHLQGMRLLHTFAKQEDAIQKIGRLARGGMRGQWRATVWAESVPFILESVTVIGVALALLGGSLLLGSGGTVLGSGGTVLVSLLTFLLALYRMSPRLAAVHSSLAHLASDTPHLARLVEIFNAPADPIPVGGRVFRGLCDAIVFHNVTLRYRPEEPPALSEISFTVPRGSFIALVGPSGAGKSSVVDLLVRLFEPTSGTIVVDGVELRLLDLILWRRHLSVVSQDCFLFHASICDNIRFGRSDATMDEVVGAARAAYAHEFILRLAEGYDTVIGDRGYRLSGGQRQRIALARALIAQPDLLILDEATSALDSESERLIRQTLDEQRGTRTVLAIAHRLFTMAHADQIVVLDEGRLVERGTHAELLARDGIYAGLWRLQSKEPAVQDQLVLEARPQ
jgi:ATP-binding cassette subfamily B protein/subfamily B ATP-binding cassette protein MsbA